MRSKLVASFAATFLLVNVGQFPTYAQEPKAKKPSQPSSDVLKAQETPRPKVLVVRPQPGSQQKPPAERPKIEPLSKAELSQILRGVFEELPPLEPAESTIYLTQYAPQIVSERGWLTYQNPKQVDVGLAYFWGDPGSSFGPDRPGIVDFALNGEGGHQYLVQFWVGWAAGTRRFKISGAGNEQTTPELEGGTITKLYAVVDLQNLPSGRYSVRIEPGEQYQSYGGQWFFIGVVVYTFAFA